jgi:glycosyltransferase involved in cell wall biosynthesis
MSLGKPFDRTQGKVSVVIPSYNEGENLVDTVGCILDHASSEDFEIVVVDDGSTDGSGERVSWLFGSNGQTRVLQTPGLGVAGARNLGAQAAQGDVLIFLDAHSYTPPGWIAALITPLVDPQVGMVGPAFASLQHGNDVQGLGVMWRDASLEIEWLPRRSEKPYPVPLLTGGCQVIRRSDFQKLGGYDSGMTRWGSEDQKLSLRTWLMGYQLVVQPQAVIYHLFRERHPYVVEESKVLYNRLRMALLHLSLDRIGRIIDYHKGMPGFSQSVVLLLESDVMTQRRQLEQIRQRDNGWFFAQFGRQI